MDNWYYNAKSRLRYRLIDGKWQRDSTEFRGQWGISHDDEGRLVLQLQLVATARRSGAAQLPFPQQKPHTHHRASITA